MKKRDGSEVEGGKLLSGVHAGFDYLAFGSRRGESSGRAVEFALLDLRTLELPEYAFVLDGSNREAGDRQQLLLLDAGKWFSGGFEY